MRVWRRAELDQMVRRLPPGVEVRVIPLTTGTDGGVLDFTLKGLEPDTA